MLVGEKMVTDTKKGDIEDLMFRAFRVGYACGVVGHSWNNSKEFFYEPEQKPIQGIPRKGILRFMELSHKAGESGLTWDEWLQAINNAVEKFDSELDKP